MQKAFLHELRDLVNRGEKRALLVSATGTGKTYASAFAVRELNPRRMLFLVHREQIARKAMESYRNVFGDTRTYGLVSGTSKEFDKDFVFATIWTIAKDVVLQNDNRCMDSDSLCKYLLDDIPNRRVSLDTSQLLLPLGSSCF